MRVFVLAIRCCDQLTPSGIVGVPRLFQYADEFQKLNVHYQLDGDQRGWHYDGSDFVAMLMLQQGSGGGEFEFAPFIRGGQDAHADESFDRVRELFDGGYAGAVLTSGSRPAPSTSSTAGERCTVLALSRGPGSAPSPSSRTTRGPPASRSPRRQR